MKTDSDVRLVRGDAARPRTAAEWLDRVSSAQARGELLLAVELATQGLDAFPADRDLQYRAVLCLARAGASAQAEAMFNRFGLADHPTEDVLALDARIAKDKALRQDGPARRQGAAAAADLYERIHLRTGGSYPGINAATLRLLAGDDASARRLAAEVAARTVGAQDYYGLATVAEAALLAGDMRQATEALAAAARLPGLDLTAVAGTRRQLRLICRARGFDAAPIEAALPVPQVIHFTGHMASPPGGHGRLSAAALPAIRAAIGEVLEQEKVGQGYGSLACGADILFAEALLARGADLHVVLPFGRADFERISVARGGLEWRTRFDACLERAASVTLATEDEHLGDDWLFAYASRLAMGLAIAKAQAIDAGLAQVAVWDGAPAEGAAGTGYDVAFWRGRGLRSIVVPSVPGAGAGTPLPPAPSASAQPPRPESGPARRVVAMLFGDVKGFSGLRESQMPPFVQEVLGAFATAVRRHEPELLYRNTWGDGLYFVLRTPRAAGHCALDLQEAIARLDLVGHGLPAGMALRIGGHVGPVFPMDDPVTGARGYFGAHVTRTARIEPITPPGGVFVTEPFAAALALEPDCGLACDYAGMVPLAKGYGAERMYLLRR